MNELAGIKESDTGLAPPALWDLAADKQNLANEQPLQVPTINKFCLGLLIIFSLINLLTGCSMHKDHQC